MPPASTADATDVAVPVSALPLVRTHAIANAARRYLPTVLIFAAVFVVWQLLVTVLGIKEYILPSPAAVWRALVHSDIAWGKHMMITTLEIVGGFVLAGVVGVLLGTAIAWSDMISRALMPF